MFVLVLLLVISLAAPIGAKSLLYALAFVALHD